MKIHLYMLCYRSEALVASHLEPEAFGHYMATGTRKLTRGSLMFFEVDGRKLDPARFRLHDLDARCVPHSDGSPKRSKYVSIYRVLENLDLAAIERLYLVTFDGRTLGIEPTVPNGEPESPYYLYQELCPVTPLICSTLRPSRFCRFMTDPEIPLFIPKLFFADLLLEHEPSGELATFLPYDDPAHIAECVRELQARHDKPTKTVSRNPRFNAFYRTINRGFYVGDRERILFFPFPQVSTLETVHAHWWRSAQNS